MQPGDQWKISNAPPKEESTMKQSIAMLSQIDQNNVENISGEAMAKVVGGGSISLSFAALQFASKLTSKLTNLPAAPDAFAGGTPTGGAETGGFNPAMFGD